MSYIGNSPGVASSRVTTTITATASQTVFTTQSGYVLGYVDVYLNGVKLVNGADFEAITGTSITLFTGATVNDVIELVSFVPRGLSDGYTKSEADAKFLDVGGDTATSALNFASITATSGVVNANSSTDAFRITQTGTGNAFVVEDSTSPDATPFVIDNVGNVIAGWTSAFQTPAQGVLATPAFQTTGTTLSTSAFGLFRWNNAASSRPNLIFSKSRSNSTGDHVVVLSGDDIGALNFNGSDGTNFVAAATISAAVDGTPGLNDMPGRLVFSTTAAGASSPTERMRITSAGNVGVGTIAPATKLEVSSATGSATPTPTEIRISTTTNASDYSTTLPWGRLSYYSADPSSGGAKIQASIDVIAAVSNGGSSSLAFSTATYATGTLTEGMRLDNSGNVGIGTALPAYKLDITGQGRATTGWAVSTDGSAFTPSGLNAIPNYGVGYITSTSQTALSGFGGIPFYTNQLERMRIDASGNLLVGTTSQRGLVTARKNMGGGFASSFTAIAVGGAQGQLAGYSFMPTFTGTADNEPRRAADIWAGFNGNWAAEYLSFGVGIGVGNDGGAQTTERMRITGAGNVGIGTTNPVAKLAVVGGTTNASSLATAYSLATFNITPKSSSGYSLQFGSGPADLPYIQMSAGGAAAGDMTIQPYGGSVSIGNSSSPSTYGGKLSVFATAASQQATVFVQNPGTGSLHLGFAAASSNVKLYNCYADGLLSGGKGIDINSSGNVGIGETGPICALHVSRLAAAAATNALAFTLTRPGTADSMLSYWSDAYAPNGASATLKLGSISATNRSINATGTVNASGSDYAEYMTKYGDFVVAKGDVVGIDANGKLTNVFADAVSFIVKSTDPSFVGGDGWGSDFDDNSEELETARQLVDRVAFAGQVPVNVINATAGQYIIPVNHNGAIKGEAVSNPTFEQYQQAVGKVIAIEADGRARIIVKVA